MSTTYLINFPRKYMRVVAGHHHHGQYFLSRASITPPQKLISLVFPKTNRDYANLSRGGDYEPSLSGRGFLNLIKYLRTVFFYRIPYFFVIIIPIIQITPIFYFNILFIRDSPLRLKPL